MGNSTANNLPNISKAKIKSVLWEYYRIKATITPLPGQRDQNFLVVSDEEKYFVFKVFNPGEEKEFIEAQNFIFNELTSRQIPCPTVVKAKSGHELINISIMDGSNYRARLTHHIQGKPLAEIDHVKEELLADIGSFMGKLDKQLSKIDHPAFHRDFYWDITKGPKILEEHVHLIDDLEIQSFIRNFLQEYQSKVVPNLANIRKSVIHNDANDYNLLVTETFGENGRDLKFSGIIDFGDMVFGYTLSDLAILIAYMLLNADDYLTVASIIVKNFHRAYPLSKDDLKILHYFVCMRLCMSICIAAFQVEKNPENSYLSISQELIRKKLPDILKIPPSYAEAIFRFACNMNPNPRNKKIIKYLTDQKENIYPIMGTELTIDNCLVLDLSVSSQLINFNKDENDCINITMDHGILNAKEKIPYWIGQYNESRIFSTHPKISSESTRTHFAPEINFGLDIFGDLGKTIYAPLDGKIFLIKNNNPIGDNHSTLILLHNTDDGDPFLTVYDNIRVNTLHDNERKYCFKPGESIGKGEVLGEIGFGWTFLGKRGHLHIQLFTGDINDYERLAGFRTLQKDQQSLHLTPNPNYILKIPIDAFPQKRTNKQIINQRSRNLGRNLSLSYQIPLRIQRGWMQYLFNEKGRKYLDAYNNVPHVGHCHPDVVEAGFAQGRILNTNTRYLHDLIVEYAEKLLDTVPDPLRVCFFVNSGSEANELAMRLARAYTNHKDLIVLDGAYHGNTISMIDISPYKHEGPGGMGAPDWVHCVPLPDPYRKRDNLDDKEFSRKYASYVYETIFNVQAAGNNLCGFIAETCPSVAGQLILPKGYLKRVYEAIRSVGGVCIADEVQTAYGRLGTHFYAFQDHDIVPDILVLGKPIGNGHPLGVVMTTVEIANAFDNGMEFFSTFGGNPVSCAIGLKVLDIVKKEKLQIHALEVGEHLIQGLRNLQLNHSVIGDVRGSGLFIGVELVRDLETLEPATTEAQLIVNQLYKRGILIGSDGIYNNVLKIRPPMPFNMSDADELLENLKEILAYHFP